MMESYTTLASLSEMKIEFRQLVESARAATSNAYAPYSAFHVGAAILMSDGTVVLGSNQENAAYPACMCAERVALYRLDQFPDRRIEALAVVARKKNEDRLVSAAPCGSCRQVLLEYETRQQRPYSIILHYDDKWIIAPSAKTLLPFSFTGDSLL